MRACAGGRGARAGGATAWRSGAHARAPDAHPVVPGARRLRRAHASEREHFREPERPDEQRAAARQDEAAEGGARAVGQRLPTRGAARAQHPQRCSLLGVCNHYTRTSTRQTWTG